MLNWLLQWPYVLNWSHRTWKHLAHPSSSDKEISSQWRQNEVIQVSSQSVCRSEINLDWLVALLGFLGHYNVLLPCCGSVASKKVYFACLVVYMTHIKLSRVVPTALQGLVDLLSLLQICPHSLEMLFWGEEVLRPSRFKSIIISSFPLSYLRPGYFKIRALAVTAVGAIWGPVSE